MQINIPQPQPRKEGEFATYVDIAYGDPSGTIHLADSYGLDLRYVTPEDCDRLIIAATQVKSKILAYRAEAAAPHGKKNVYQGTCQLCGKPAGDKLHADPAPACGAPLDGGHCALPFGHAEDHPAPVASGSAA